MNVMVFSHLDCLVARLCYNYFRALVPDLLDF